MYNTSLAHLDRLPDHVRDDYLRLVEWTVAELPSRWSSRLSVPLLWLSVGTTGDAVTAERVATTELYRRNGYPDEFLRWVMSAVQSRMTEIGGRCAAIVFNDRVESPLSGPLLSLLLGPPETNVFLYAAHRDVSQRFRDSFRIRRGPLRRLGFVPDVHRKLADARRTWPNRTGSGRD
ncbi:hypothetical protein E1211_23455 [Micromonospora sp. 15K316]|uniref:hypothetical protein n=1 Tax=Micromonospora sp. 15K316 TaxID=2530376 RepID=UPI0010469430|nr:hypothetical protein [Micromonospora sp. 15K316]TDC30874.1 hypothetical protein E1211_23455 [Micromonospora sp. 15K316]